MFITVECVMNNVITDDTVFTRTTNKRTATVL